MGKIVIMNEQRVEIEIHGKKFEFMIPYNEYIPTKKAEKRIHELISQIDFKKDQVDHALVYAAIKLAVQNDSFLSKNTEQTKRIREMRLTKFLTRSKSF